MIRSLTLFSPWAGGAAVGALACLMVVTSVRAFADEPDPDTPPRPNILWITSEDNGQQLGCYGDDYATTPHLDRLASQGVRYQTCWSNAPVCAPARTTIITGLYATSVGGQHMRSEVPLPPTIQLYPYYLRQAGYYCTNNSKEDYNLRGYKKAWDESSNKAHYKNRNDDRPFFAVFNLTVSHESQIRTRPHELVHDPAKVRLPAYHPDRPEVRRDWAQYYDKVTEMDRQAGRILEELDQSGLADDTIVIYYGDHGSGMPRSKRWPYDSGLRVPLIVRIPEKFQHLRPEGYQSGGEITRLVSFVDLAPTVLAIAGAEIPSHMQGTPFLGESLEEGPAYLYGFRDRMDERYDLVRSLTDGRYVYIRNFMPHRPYGQYIAYMFQTPTTRIWKQLHDQGELTKVQGAFWRTKPTEELYDLQADPDEVNNLIEKADQAERVATFRAALREHLLATRDTGFLPEAEMHRRAGEDAPYTMAQDVTRYPLDAILAVAETVTTQGPSLKAEEVILENLTADDPALRFWAATGCRIRPEVATGRAKEPLVERLSEDNPSVRVAAAESLVLFGDDGDRQRALAELLILANHNRAGYWTAVQALYTLDTLAETPGVVPPDILIAAATVSPADNRVPGRVREYVTRLVERIQSHLAAPDAP